MREMLNQKIEKHITDLITNGQLKEGDLLPSEPELSRRFKTSRMPVRQAVQNLVDHGLLRKVHGKGTYVRKKRPVGPDAPTNKIGVLVAYPKESFFGSTFYAAIMSGIQQETLESEKALLLHALPQVSPAAILHELVNEVDGFLFVDLLPSMAAGLEKTLAALPKPVVMVNYEHAWDNVDAVVTDSHGNTRRAVEFLIGLGHTRIAYACQAFDAGHPNLLHRLEAYKQTLLAHGLPIDPGLIVIERDLTEAALDRLFGQDPPPTAVFCIGSHVAHVYLYPYFARTGRRVPEDVSVVSYDDVRECELVRPRLTAVGVSLPDVGRLGVKRLLERLAEQRNGIDRHYTITVPGAIIERESHRAIKQTL